MIWSDKENPFNHESKLNHFFSENRFIYQQVIRAKKPLETYKYTTAWIKTRGRENRLRYQ